MFRQAETPKACCCCLSDPAEIEHESIAGSGLEFELDLPWCLDCRRRRKILVGACVIGGVAGVAAMLLIVRPSSLLEFLVGASTGFFVPFLSLLELLPRIFPHLRRRGHVRGCDAYGGGNVLLAEGTNKHFGNVVLRNRAFARMFERMNR